MASAVTSDPWTSARTNTREKRMKHAIHKGKQPMTHEEMEEGMLAARKAAKQPPRVKKSQKGRRSKSAAARRTRKALGEKG